jgi:choline dehydrogenase
MPAATAAWHGLDGPLEVTSRAPWTHPVCKAFLEAGQQLQYPLNDNFNGRSIEGVGYYHHSICAHGKRMSSARAWFKPALQRSGLLAGQRGAGFRPL